MKQETKNEKMKKKQKIEKLVKLVKEISRRFPEPARNPLEGSKNKIL